MIKGWLVVSVLSLNQAMISKLCSDFPGRLRDILATIEYKKLVLSFIPFTFYLLVFRFYKEIRAITSLDDVSHPHIDTLGNIESTVFFVQVHSVLSRLANPIFDFLAAIPYLLHFPLPFLFALFLILHPNRRGAVYPFLWCAGWVNFIAAIIQLTLPTAPPWYADSVVYGRRHQIVYLAPCEAGFHRLDQLMGVSAFHSLYSKSPVTFGAFPSLHVAIPVVVFLNHPWGGWKVGLTHVVWIALAAMYSTHHYFIDVIGGLFLALLVRLFMLKLWSPFEECKPNNKNQDTTSQINRLLKLTYRLPSTNNLINNIV